MRNSVLLSIKPVFAERIFSGHKQYEFRKAIFKNRDVKRVYVYASAPVSQVIGEFEVDEILALDLDTLWHITQKHAGIPQEYFYDYFHGHDFGYAIKISRAVRYDSPLDLRRYFGVEYAPQSFVYVAQLATD